MRILALDIGEKNIGLAVSDEMGWTAQGLPSLQRKNRDNDFCAIAEIAKKMKVQEIVVGMPLNLDNTPGEKAKQVARFTEDLKKKITLPVRLWDERLSTVQAEKVMLQADLSRKKRKKKIDQLCAQLILQSYLDSKAESENVQKDNSQ